MPPHRSEQISFMEQASRNYDAILCLKEALGGNFKGEFTAYQDKLIRIDMYRAHQAALQIFIEYSPNEKVVADCKNELRAMQKAADKNQFFFAPSRFGKNINYLMRQNTYAIHSLLTAREKAFEAAMGLDKNDFDLNKIEIGVYSAEEYRRLNENAETPDDHFLLCALKHLHAMTVFCSQPHNHDKFERYPSFDFMSDMPDNKTSNGPSV